MKRFLSLTLAFLLLCSPVFGATDLQPFNFLKNSGGLNTTAAPTSLEANEAQDLQNIDFNEFGAIKKRQGYDTLNSTALTGATQVTGLFQYRLNDGTSKFVTTHDDNFYKMDTSGGVPDGTWDDITSGETITAANRFSFATIRNITIATNGENLVFKYDAVGSPNDLTQLSVPTGLTKAKYVVGFKERTILANVTVSGTAHPSRFYFSNIGTLETWIDTRFIDVQPNDGQEIKGIAVLGERLVILKDFSIYNVLFTGDADVPFIVRKSASDVGTVSHWSITDIKNNLAFLAPDGIYVYNGSESVKISDKIEKTLGEFTTSALSDTVGVNYRTLNQYWLTFADISSSTDTIIIWDYANNAFAKHTGILASVLTILYDGNNLERLYHGDYKGFVYENNTGNCDKPEGVETAIDAFYITKWFDFGVPSNYKRVQFLFLYVNEEGDWDINVSYTFDFDAGDWKTATVNLFDTGGIVGVAIVGTDIVGGKDGIIKRLDLEGSGQVVRFKFSNANIDEPFTINGFSALVRLMGVGRP